MRLFSPNAFATDTDDGRTLPLLTRADVDATHAPGVTRVESAAAAAIAPPAASVAGPRVRVAGRDLGVRVRCVRALVACLRVGSEFAMRVGTRSHLPSWCNESGQRAVGGGPGSQ